MKAASLKPIRRVVLVVLALGCVPGAARADIVVTLEAPGVQASTVSGVSTETFNGFPLGLFATLVSPVGTFTAGPPGMGITPPGPFGGAFQTQYLLAGAGAAPVITLDLAGAQAYVGFYLPALDFTDTIRLFSGGTLLASFNLSTLSPFFQTTGGPFGMGHFGNPNTGQNPTEPYAYLNFFGTAGTTFDRIVFDNGGPVGGLEVDNVSVRATPVAPPFPGTLVATIVVIPEPGSVVLLSLGGAVVLASGWRRRRPAGLRGSARIT